jgi:DNA-binding Lrp family transcriptional regulator
MGSMKALARGILDGTGELDDYARKVMGSSQMDGAKVLVISEAHKAQRESGTLTRLDLRIIGALREDGRKPLAIVAKEVDATAKTVRRRVGRLRDLGMVAFDVIEDTNASSGAIAAVIETYLDGSVDREEIAKDISQNHGISSSGLLRFSNDQSFMLCLTWVNSIGELDRLCQAIAANKGVSKAVPNVVLGSRSFDTWFDRLLEDAGSAERALASKNLI